MVAALSFHKPPENKVYKFLCHGWIHNSWPIMKLNAMWISTKYAIKHHENSCIYELMQLISNSPIISTESRSHCFLDLFFLLTSYPTKNCVCRGSLMFHITGSITAMPNPATEHWGSSEVTKWHSLPLAWRAEEQPEQPLAKLTPQLPDKRRGDHLSTLAINPFTCTEEIFSTLSDVLSQRLPDH